MDIHGLRVDFCVQLELGVCYLLATRDSRQADCCFVDARLLFQQWKLPPSGVAHSHYLAGCLCLRLGLAKQGLQQLTQARSHIRLATSSLQSNIAGRPASRRLSRPQHSPVHPATVTATSSPNLKLSSSSSSRTLLSSHGTVNPLTYDDIPCVDTMAVLVAQSPSLSL